MRTASSKECLLLEGTCLITVVIHTHVVCLIYKGSRVVSPCSSAGSLVSSRQPCIAPAAHAAVIPCFHHHRRELPPRAGTDRCTEGLLRCLRSVALPCPDHLNGQDCCALIPIPEMGDVQLHITSNNARDSPQPTQVFVLNQLQRRNPLQFLIAFNPLKHGNCAPKGPCVFNVLMFFECIVCSFSHVCVVFGHTGCL